MRKEVVMKRCTDCRIVKILSFLTFFWIVKFTAAQDSIPLYWYVNGEKVSYFFSVGTSAYKIPPGILTPELLQQHDLTASEIIRHYTKDIIKVSTWRSGKNVELQLNSLLKKLQIESEKLLVMRYSPGYHLPPRDIYIDNQLLVKFSAHYISSHALQQFMDKYDIELVHRPDEQLPTSGNYTYIFSIKNTPDISYNSATVAARIYEENRGIVAEAIPNMLNMFEQSGDAYLASVSWHLHNRGQTQFCSIQARQICDTRISDVWEMGYSGQGIKVGVIDVHGFDYAHPDMIGRLLPGWDFIHNSPLTSENSKPTARGQSHGMAVAGIIAAKSSSSQGVMGVAYNAKIVPFLVDLSDASVVKALQKAMHPEFDVDVLNCSFSGTANNPLIESEIKNLVRHGRQRLGKPLGITIVCSAGNDNMSDDFLPYFPAAYPDVIAVSVITPEDRRKEIQDKWNTGGTSWAPNYGSNIFVAAPGICIPTTDYTGSDGYSSSSYISFSRTSAATPIVSGLVALLLSKEPYLSVAEVKTRIAQGAEKVGGYNYHYDPTRPGHSKEIGYGRINAYNTLLGIESPMIHDTSTLLSIDEHPAISLRIQNPVTNRLRVFYIVNREVLWNIHDISGQKIFQATLPKEQNEWEIDAGELPPGVYLSEFICREEKWKKSARFIKLW